MIWKETITVMNSEFTERLKNRLKLNLFLRVYAFMGLLIAILAGAYFILTLLPLTLTAQQRITLVVAGTGIALAVTSWAVVVLRKSRESEEMDRLKEQAALSLLLDTWARFERTGKEALTKEGVAFDPHSLRSMFSLLYEEGKIDKNDLIRLEEALKTRNAIVHGQIPPSSDFNDVIKAITSDLIEVIKKMGGPRRTDSV